MNELKISEHNIKLLYDNPNNNAGVRGVREVIVLSNISTFTMMVDERFNEIDFIYSIDTDDPFRYSNKIADYLKDKYNQLKSTNFRYKRGDGYDGDLHISVEEFIRFLREENRDIIIEKILN